MCFPSLILHRECILKVRNYYFMDKNSPSTCLHNLPDFTVLAYPHQKIPPPELCSYSSAMPFEWGLRRRTGISFCEDLLTTPWEDFYLLLFERASLTTATTEMFNYLMISLLNFCPNSAIEGEEGNSKANFRKDENWKPNKAWETYHIPSLASLRVWLTSSLKYLFLFMVTPEHGRGLQRLPSKLRPSQSCVWGVLPKFQLEDSSRRRLCVWFKGNPCCFRPVINIMRSLGVTNAVSFNIILTDRKLF